MIVGIAGSVGAGKSTVRALLEEIGAVTLDADSVVHAVLETEEIRRRCTEAFGSSILLSTGHVDRRRLAVLAFQNEETLARLEAIVHPEVRRRIEGAMAEHRASASPSGVLAVEIPLLARSSLRANCDRVLFVDAAETVRRARLGTRGGSAAEWSRREAYLGNLAELRLEADDVVDNGGSLEETRGQIRRIWTRWMGPARDISPEPTLGKGTEVEVERTK